MLAFLKADPVEDEVVTLPPPDLRLRDTITLDDATLDRYVGQYELGPNTILTISKAEGTLIADLPGQGRFTFYPETETIFFMKEADVQITFVEDEQGNLSQIVVHMERTEMQGGRVP